MEQIAKTEEFRMVRLLRDFSALIFFTSLSFSCNGGLFQGSSSNQGNASKALPRGADQQASDGIDSELEKVLSTNSEEFLEDQLNYYAEEHGDNSFEADGYTFGNMQSILEYGMQSLRGTSEASLTVAEVFEKRGIEVVDEKSLTPDEKHEIMQSWSDYTLNWRSNSGADELTAETEFNLLVATPYEEYTYGGRGSGLGMGIDLAATAAPRASGSKCNPNGNRFERMGCDDN